MKKNLFKFLISFFSLFIFIIFYLSFVGIETEKFNQQIKDKVIQSNKDLNIDLKRVKLTLDLLKFSINAKTIGAIIYHSNRPLELEYIKTNVSIDSIFKNKLVSSNFEIATKSILIKDLVKFVRSITFRPELLILETIIKDGQIILDLNLNLDQDGKIKNNYEVKGILKEGKIKFLKDIDFNKINFLFNFKEKNYLFKDIKFSSDKVNFNSNLLKIVKKENSYLIEGKLENSKSNISKNLVKLLNLNLNNLDTENTIFSSKTDFIFQIDRKLKFQNLKLLSKINFNQIIYKDEYNLSDYFPEVKKNFLLNNHDLNLKYEKNILSVNGKGKIKIGNNFDKIEYFIIKKNKNLEFETDLNIKKTKIKNQKLFKSNFPLTKDYIDLKNHNLNIKYKNKKLYLTGEGGIRLEEEFDNIQYFIIKKKDDFNLKSEVDLQNISFKNQKIFKKFFPSTRNLVNLKNHKIKINYKKNFISFSGEGKIKIDNEYDKIDYFISRERDETNFDINANLNKTDFQIENINFKKNKNFITKLNISGSFLPKEKLILNNLSVLDKKNKIKITNLVFDKNNFLIELNEADFNYIDKEKKENQYVIRKVENNNYKLNGLFFNANTIVTNLLDGKENNENKFLKNNLSIILNLNEVYLDEINFIRNLQGNIFIKENKVFDANLSANFDRNNNIVFTINTKDNKKITKLYSSKAKPLVNRYKFIKGFDEGYLDFISTKKNRKSISNLKIYNFKLKEVPILTKLLTLASLQGIADILTGEGIRFDEFEMNYNNEGNLMTIDEIYAIGPAISILMNGYLEKDKLISLRGTLVPATTINKTISKIPVLGKILVGKKTGEGVFGVSFKIKGPPKNLETTVNPIKTLTPRFITRTLDKLKKN